MKASIFVALTSAALAAAQGVTGKIAPKASAPDGCKPAFNGLFQVTVETVTTVKGKRDLTRLNVRFVPPPLASLASHLACLLAHVARVREPEAKRMLDVQCLVDFLTKHCDPKLTSSSET